MLTVEEVSVAVSWCTALMFSTSLMTSAKVLGSFSYILAVMLGASQSPLTKNADCHSVTVKSKLLSHCFKVMDISSKFHCPSVVSIKCEV